MDRSLSLLIATLLSLSFAPRALKAADTARGALRVKAVERVAGRERKPLAGFGTMSPGEQAAVMLVDWKQGDAGRGGAIVPGVTVIPEGRAVQVKNGYAVTFECGPDVFTTSGTDTLFRVNAPEVRQERITVNFQRGNMLFRVNRKIYFTVHFRTVRVYVRGTAFTVDAAPSAGGGTCAVNALKNRVCVEQDYDVNVAGQYRSGFKRVDELGEGTSKEFRLEYGQAWQKYGSYPLMAAHFRKELEAGLADKADHARLLAAYNNLGRSYSDQGGNPDEAIRAFTSGIALAKEKSEGEWLGCFYTNLGSVYADRGDQDRAMEHFQAALGEFKAAGVTGLNLGGAYFSLGGAHRNRGEINRALEYYQSALKEYKNADVTGLSLGNAYSSMGNVYQMGNRPDTALEYYQTALKEYKNAGVTGLNLGNTYGNMGNVYQVKGSPDRAMEYYQSALKEYKSAGVTGLNLGSIYGNMGVIYQNRKDYDRAMEHYQLTLKEYRAAGVKGLNLGNLYGNLAVVSRRKNDSDGALKYYHLALKEFADGKVTGLPLATTYFNIACLFERKKDPSAAVNYFEKARDEYRRAGRADQARECEKSIEALKKTIK